MSEQNHDPMVDTITQHKPTVFEKMLEENTIAKSIIIGALIVAVSVVSGAFIIKGGGIGFQDTGVAGQKAAAPIQVKVADRGDAPTIGSKNAPVTLYEFADFQCPFCQSFFKNSYPALKAKYIDTGKVRLVFRHFPLSFHVNAQIASEAAECANRQGQFEAYYNILFTKGSGDGKGLDATSLKTYASQIGLNMTAFNQCLDNHETKAVVAGDQAEGSKNGVDGTPTFFLKGKSIVGAQPVNVFEQALDEVLK